MRFIDVDALEKFLADAEVEATKRRKYVLVSALNTIQGNIRNFPTTEPEPQWIPCSEDLPKKPCECIATIEVQIWENTHRIVRKTKFANGRFRGADKVLAWMPWPDPYGGEQE